MSDEISSQSAAPAAVAGPGGDGNQNYSNFSAFAKLGSNYQMVEVYGQVQVANASVQPTLSQWHESGVPASVLVLALNLPHQAAGAGGMTWAPVEFAATLKLPPKINQVQIVNAQLGNLTIQVS